MQHVYLISKRYLYFWLFNGQKPGKGNDVTFFEMQFLAFLIVARKNKSPFWNTETRLDKIGVFLEENDEIRNLT